MALTSADKTVIRSSWSELSKNAEGNGAKFMIKLFTLYPTAQDFFSFAKGRSLDDVKTDAKLAAHGGTLMGKLDKYVAALDDGEALAEEVKRLTETHLPRGIRFQHYETIRATYFKFLPEALGSSYTPAAGEAWDKLLQAHNALCKQAEA